MKILRSIIVCSLLLTGLAALAQVESASGVTRRSGKDRKKRGVEADAGPRITDRMQSFYDIKEPHDADLAWMRTIYSQIDLSKDANAPLYFPEDVVDGQENLFRIMLGLVVDGKIPAYEYLDGREVYSDKYQIKVQEMLDRFGIYYKTGESGRNGQKFVIEEADVPTSQVLNYYIVEKWEFDKRSNQMKTRVEAICPVLNRYGDFGGEAKYPMFWVKFDQLRPYLAQQYVFLSDDNNLAQYSLDDYFNMGMYDGDIYKTKNLRNLSMAQMFPDPDDMKLAQDSIEKRLHAFGDNLWVPSREEYLAQLEREQNGEAEKADKATYGDNDSPTERVSASDNQDTRKSVRTKRTNKSKKRKAPKAPKVKNSSGGNQPNSSAEKSVRRRRR